MWPWPITHELSIAELHYSERWVVTAQTIWPSKPETPAAWPLTQSLSILFCCQLPSSQKLTDTCHLWSYLNFHNICHRCHVLRSFLLPGGQWSELRPARPTPWGSSQTRLCEHLRAEIFKVILTTHLASLSPHSPHYGVVNYTSTPASGSTRTAQLESRDQGWNPPVRALPKTQDEWLPRRPH